MNKMKLFKLLGIDIELHYTWFLIFILLAWGLSADFFPSNYPNLSQTAYWIIGLASAVLLFASVLAHEYSHSLVARKNNINVNKITLFFFGGIAHIMGEENLTPKKEFKMAIAGPLLSFVLAGIFFLIFKFVGFVYVNAISFYLYKLNFILALFNLAPGYPLDGGRVLRSIAWGITKDIRKATSIASKGGKIIAGIMILFGFVGIFMGRGTLWFVILGFFLYFIAGASYKQIMLKEILGKIKIKKVMVKDLNTVSPDMNLADLFEKHFLKYGTEGALVAKKKKFLGIITMDALKNIPKKSWPKEKIKDYLTPESKIPKAKENENAFKVLSKMSKMKSNIMPVIKNKKLVGAVSIGSLMRYVKLSEESNP